MAFVYVDSTKGMIYELIENGARPWHEALTRRTRSEKKAHSLKL